ncbi:MAG TPA: bifunctional phosphopantothenoylcysteine decarboxylase/phosphopantothenate--cysteine ligase CoaBC [Rhodanobacteraceae bacterium]|nr:bifunctional phosphopantothenoylcysteine decarboxylase/phosphopantothenate--cysteine ligase CoaBC [Rhodanobacteraceae bacterium]
MSARFPDQRRILLGVSGGIAAYKACELTRRLREAGAEVRVVLTANAARFVTPLTFQALSGQPVRADLWDEAAEMGMGHLELARWAQRVLIAPASADVIAKLAHGFADDLLSTLCLATTAPVCVAPAMNHRMWLHPATQANIAALRARGAAVIGPDDGPLAEGESGPGRLREPQAIVAELIRMEGEAHENVPSMAGELPLRGVRVVVNAGPTYEDIDPVRFLGNRSSGRMGFAVAQAALDAGAQVTLVAGPVALSSPSGARRIDVRSAREMRDAVLAAMKDADLFIATAAVADWRPAQPSAQKTKKRGTPPTIALVENPDILAEVASMNPKPFVVGFAAETEDLERNARDKLARKKLDMIAANEVGADRGMETADNALHLFWSGGDETLPRMPKSELAVALIRRIAARYRARGKQ